MRKLSDSTQIKLGAVISYMQMGLSILIGIVYTPVMIRLLGQGEYGLYSMSSSTISMLSILNLGFMSGYVRFYSKYRADDAYESIYKLNGLYLTIFAVLGGIALTAGLVLSNNLTYVFADGLTQEEYRTAKILMTILAINLAISFPMGVFQCIINANQKFVFLKLVGILRTVISPLVTLPLLLMGCRSVMMVIVQTSLSVVVDVVYVLYVFKVINMKFRFAKPEKSMMSNLFGFTIFIAIELIVDQINWNIDRVLLGRFQGTASVAVYTVGATLYNYYQMFSTAIAGVFTPRVHRIYNSMREDQESCNRVLTELFTKVGRCQFLLLALVASGIVIFGRQFIHLWVGSEYNNSYYVVILLVLPATIALIQNIGIEIQRAKNMHQFRTIAYSIMAVLNLGISIILCKQYGAIGAACGTTIALLVANGLIMNVYYHVKVGIDIKSFWINILKLSKGLIVPALFGVAYMKMSATTDMKQMMVFIPVYIVVYCCSMWIFGMNRYEKDLIRGPMQKVKRSMLHE